jgi:hypothetical protein
LPQQDLVFDLSNAPQRRVLDGRARGEIVPHRGRSRTAGCATRTYAEGWARLWSLCRRMKL